MAVLVGSARSDENGKAYNGKAGDQKSGREVSTQSWYKHSKGWRVFRAKNLSTAKLIAYAMRVACSNEKIGYDQWNRNTLYTQAEKVDFNPGRVTTACETDCSALVRVCCAYAGIKGIPADFRTGNMPSYLMATGQFVELKGSKYTDQSAYLGEGDILVTKTSGHTVVVLTNGPKYEGGATVTKSTLGDRLLKRGTSGSDVEALQTRLNALGFDCGKVDGDFGGNTEKGVKAFQRAAGIEVDGKFGQESLEALIAMEADKTPTEYTVKAGDSLWKIAKELLGNGSRYGEIIALNGIKNDVIRVGQVLKIPKK